MARIASPRTGDTVSYSHMQFAHGPSLLSALFQITTNRITARIIRIRAVAAAVVVVVSVAATKEEAVATGTTVIIITTIITATTGTIAAKGTAAAGVAVATRDQKGTK